MTMFSLAKAIGEILSPEFTVISVFPAGTTTHEMTFAVELEDEINVTARIGRDASNNPAAIRWLQQKYAREVASITYLEAAIPSVPVPYVIQVDHTSDNAVDAPYLVVEDPLGEQLCNAIHDMDMRQKETCAAALGEALAGIHRLSLPCNKIGTISGTDSRGAPIVGPIARSWAHSAAAGRPEGPFDNIKQFLSNELAQCARVAQDDPSSGEEVRALLGRLNALLPHITPLNDPVSQRLALSYSNLSDASIFVSEDGTLGGVAGLEATVLPACLAASWPVFLRRDGMYCKAYKTPGSSYGPLLPDNEVAHLRDVFLTAAHRVDPAFSTALFKGERLRQMLEFMSHSDWEGLRRWEADVRREFTGRS